MVKIYLPLLEVVSESNKVVVCICSYLDLLGAFGRLGDQGGPGDPPGASGSQAGAQMRPGNHFGTILARFRLCPFGAP